MIRIPSAWSSAKLGDWIELKYGKSLPEKSRIAGSFNVYGSNGIVGSHQESLTNAPAIIVGRKGSIGEVHYSSQPCFPIDTTYYVDDFSALDARFSWYVLRSLPLREMNRATAIPGLNRDDAYALPIHVPPLSEQRRIVAKIDSLSSKSKRAREHLDHIPRLVEKYKQAVLAGEFKRLGDNINSKRLDDCAIVVTSGSRGWAKYYSDQGSLFIRVGNVRRGDIRLSWDDIQRVSPPPGAEGQRTLVRPNDIVITITADLGRVGLVPSDLGDAYVNQHVALVRLRSDDSAPFVSWFLTSQQGQDQLLERNRGATRAGLGLDDIRAVRVPLPASTVQQKIIGRIEQAFAWIDRLAAEATSARKLIDRLDQAVLAKAFSGELVPQDPNDEPASVLLERIRAERETAPAAKPRRGRAKRS